MSILKKTVLAIIICILVCLTACSKITPQSNSGYSNGTGKSTQENQKRQLDIPQFEIDNSEVRDENQRKIGESEIEEKQNLHECSNSVILRMNDKEYSLGDVDAEKVIKILDLNNMEKSKIDEISEAFCAYEIVHENNYYGITQDLTRIEAVGKSDSDNEFSNYAKQTTDEERKILKNIISKYE